MGDRPRQRHVARARFADRYPLHVTLRIAGGLPSLRDERAHAVLIRALARGAEKPGFRVVEHSAQTNHVHLVCEAQDRDRLARGIQGLAVRIARALNRLWRRRGKLFDERYHVHVLRTPREVRNALAYVLGNSRRHGTRHFEGIDPCSSSAWFDGWREGPPREHPPTLPRASPLARARTWLLAIGWRRWGALPRTV